MTPNGLRLIVVVVVAAVIGGALKFGGIDVSGRSDQTAAAAPPRTTATTATSTTATVATTPAPASPRASTPSPAVQLAPIVAERLPASAEQAVRTFADGYVNWRAATAVDGFRRLAGLAAYQAQEAALDRARQLQAQDAGAAARANEGQLQTVRDRDRGRGRFVVVAREQASAAGAPVGPERFVAYLAVAQHTPRGWQITTWKEQQ